MQAVVDEASTLPVFGGIYYPSEAARYLRVGSAWSEDGAPGVATLARWTRDWIAAVRPATPRRRLWLFFEELVSLRIVAALRASGVRQPEIRQTEEQLREAVEAPRPFAAEQLWEEEGWLLGPLSEQPVWKSRRGQAALEFVRSRVIPSNGLKFDEESRVAVAWEPVAGITLKPKMQFGASCIDGTRIPTRAIHNSMIAGDRPERLAASYRVSLEEVLAAYNWECLLADAA